jgi:Iron-containing redox enzyme
MATLFREDAQIKDAGGFLNDDVQQSLARWNRRRLDPALPTVDWELNLARDHQTLRLEGHFLEALRAEVDAEAAAAPADPERFLGWFEDLQRSGPGQRDPLFLWLAEAASLEEMRWFLTQEAAGEAGFDDLTAYAQVKLPARAKLELARNYWDEMGRGNPKGMHGPMLEYLVRSLRLAPSIETTVWESLALANAMTAMATTRRYAFHAIGALGAIELTAPGRSAATAAGLRRLGVSGKQRHYFDLHAVLDVKHSEAWNREAIGPLVAEDPRRARAIAEGALIRLRCGERCFERYRAELW